MSQTHRATLRSAAKLWWWRVAVMAGSWRYFTKEQGKPKLLSPESPDETFLMLPQLCNFPITSEKVMQIV